MNSKVVLFIFLNCFGILESMDNTAIFFELLPSETTELIFKHAMIADPYNACQLACVCKSWNQSINDLRITADVVNTNPQIYAYSCAIKPNPKSCLQTRGLAIYITITTTFAKMMMEIPQITEEDLNNSFRSYHHIVCNKNDYFPLLNACCEANLVGVNFLLKHDVIPSLKAFRVTLGMIKKQSNYKNATKYVHIFKLLCDKNQIIARSGELLFDVHYSFTTKTERYYHLLKTLVKAETDLNYRDENDDTILSLLYYTYKKAKNKKNYKKIATLCMKHGANPYIKPKDDKCVYKLAKQNEDQSFFALIKAHYKPIAKKD